MAIIDTPVTGTVGASTPVHVVDAGTGPTVAVPEGVALAGADFGRSGTDLVIQGADGSQAVVRDFFAAEPAPALLFEGGEKQISGELAGHLAGPEAPGQYAQAGAIASAEPIGSVESIGGTVTATRADGTVVTLDVGDPVYQGDILESSASSGVGIVLADDTTFSMGADGRMVLDEMVYDPSSHQGSLAVSVLEGVFTFVSGQIAKNDPDAMVLETPVATIGIRGTQVGLELLPNRPLNAYMLEEANGFTGEAVFSGNGWVAVLNTALQGVTVAGLNTAPPPPFIASIQEIMAKLAGAFGFLPANGNANTYGVEPQGRTAAGELDEDFDTAAGGDGGDEGGFGGPPPGAPLPPTQTFGFSPINSGIAPVGNELVGGTDDGDDAEEEEEDEETPEEELLEEEAAVPGISLSGSEGDDDLSGGSGDDTLLGLGGNDFITGQGGNDFIDGGEGTDIANMNFLFGDFVFTNEDGVITITDQIQAANQGTDTIVNVEYLQFSDGVYHVADDFFQSTGFDGSEDADEFVGTQFADNANGNGGNDYLSGGAGNDTLNGGADDDTLVGGAGNDTLIGGAGIDTADYTGAGGGVAVSLLDGLASDIDGSTVGTDSLSGIENIFGGKGADILGGDDNANVIEGNGGDDAIFGGGGDDTLNGGGGDDLISGGAGNDILDGGSGAHDIADYHEATSNVDINLSDGFAEGGGDVGTDQLSNFEFAYGGSGNDHITGNSQSNSLYGHGGDDEIFGGSGDDFLFGHEGSDTIDGGEGADTIVGGAGNDVLTGGGLAFGGDQDVFEFFAGDGSDTVTDFAPNGDKLFFSGFSQGQMTFSPGDGEVSFDTFTFTNGSGSVSVTLQGYSEGIEGYTVETEGDGVAITSAILDV